MFVRVVYSLATIILAISTMVPAIATSATPLGAFPSSLGELSPKSYHKNENLYGWIRIVIGEQIKYRQDPLHKPLPNSTVHAKINS